MVELLGSLVLLVLGLAGMLVALSRGWFRLSGRPRSALSAAFGVAEDVFAPVRAQARQFAQEQQCLGDRRPSPGDPLGRGSPGENGFGGSVTLPRSAGPDAADGVGPSDAG